jgi:hypothetical protein
MTDDVKKKIINIDPKMFIMSKTTRKTRAKPTNLTSNPRIKVKSSTKPKSALTDTIKHKSILKMIRNHQEQRNKSMIDKKTQNACVIEPEFNNEFKDAQTFFEKLSTQHNNRKQLANCTLKMQPVVSSFPITPLTPINISSEMNANQSNSKPVHINPNANVTNPKYGCLKNGVLPTFRNYVNQTRKQSPMQNNSNIQVESRNPMEHQANVKTPTAPIPIKPIICDTSLRPTIVPIINNHNNIVERASIMSQYKQLTNPIKHIKPKKRKRIVRRTYKTGKSSQSNKISVLVSNKTIRNNIFEKAQLLKHSSIADIKKYLIKHGFIEVGSVAPSHILRKMYESSHMVGAEVHNRNPRNLLYNFVNDVV